MPVTDKPPPTVKFLSTPSPPRTCTAPLVEIPSVLSVVFVKVVIPLKLALPLEKLAELISPETSKSP